VVRVGVRVGACDACGTQHVYATLQNGCRHDGMRRSLAGSSRNAGRRQRFEARHPGTRSYSDWKQMLDTEQLDIVSVATYTVDPTGHDLHTEITLYCIEKGIKCVWCEKPAVAR
jgi:predicted dehydrogenase